MGDCRHFDGGNYCYYFGGKRTKEFCENECEHNCGPEIEEETWIGYTGEECINCGRVRVELSLSGKRVCEKCHMNQDTKEYEKSYF